MKKKALKFVLMLTLVVSCLGIGAIAATNSETIQAVLSYEITVKYNGTAQKLTDASGKAVFPILYNGTTYLPVRALSGLLGVAVNWDAATQTIILGTNDTWTLVPKDKIKRTYFDYTIDKASLVVGGTAYDRGLYLSAVNAFISPEFTVSLDSRYQLLAFKLCSEKDITFKVYNQDNAIMQTINLVAGVPQDIELPVGGVKSVTVKNDCSWRSYAESWPVQVVDIKVK